MKCSRDKLFKVLWDILEQDNFHSSATGNLQRWQGKPAAKRSLDFAIHLRQLDPTRGVTVSENLDLELKSAAQYHGEIQGSYGPGCCW